MSIGRIESAVTRAEARLVITWDDGRRGEIDLRPSIASRQALAPLRDPEVFHRVHVADDGWSVEWPDLAIEFGSPQLRQWAEEQAFSPPDELGAFLAERWGCLADVDPDIMDQIRFD
jgi:hypothetical protein